MNILDFIGEKLEGYDFEGRLGGFFTAFEIQQLLDNKKKFIDYYNKKETVVESIDDLIDFLVVSKFKHFDIYSDSLKKEFKSDFCEIVNFFKNKFTKYEPKQYIRFVNDKAKEIVSNYRILLHALIDIVASFCKGCHRFVLEIINEHFYLLLPLNKNYSDLIFSDKILLTSALNKKQYELFKYSKTKDYFNFIKMCKDKKVDDDIVASIIKEICDFGLSLINSCNEDNVLQFISIIQEINIFLKDIKSTMAFKFDKQLKKIDALKDKYVVKHGVYHKQEIPIAELVEYFNDEKIPWDVRFLSLSHRRIDIDGWESYYAYTIKNESESVWDKMVSSLERVDDYFTMSRQMDINLKDRIFALILSKVFINKENINKFKEQFYSIIASVYDYFQVDFDNERLKANLETMKEMFINLIDNVHNLNLLCGLNYGLTMFILGMIEEFLSNIFKALNKEIKYIDDKHLTLGVLLTDQELVGLFDEDDLKLIQYFLQDMNGVGFGYRNKFAHFKTLDLKDINDFTVLKVLHTFIYIVNCCFIKIVHEVRGKKEKKNG